MGFDEFLDIRPFAGAERFGPYVSDAAVADAISDILAKVSSPVFVFAITMENHGLLHLEKVIAADIAELYTTDTSPVGCGDLRIYLRHLRNTERMIGTLRQRLEQCSRAAGLCRFGDHLTIMSSVYDTFSVREGETDFLFWSNRVQYKTEEKPLAAHQLAIHWLRSMRIGPSR